MSTLATADLGPSDDEADTDFVPEGPPEGPKKKAPRVAGQAAGSDDDSGDDSDDEGGAEEVSDELKKLRQEREEQEALERKQRAADAFRAMLEEEKLGGPLGGAPRVQVEMVEIQRPRRFAGETIYETVCLPSDDPEVIRYLQQQEQKRLASEMSPSGSGSVTPTHNGNGHTEAAAATAAHESPSKPPLRKPMRKRPRQSLEAMAAAIDKGKKMTTLEKSQMDWKSLTSSDKHLADELQANRRSGGYLEKQAFLERVSERKESSVPGSASSGSRRG